METNLNVVSSLLHKYNINSTNSLRLRIMSIASVPTSKFISKSKDK